MQESFIYGLVFVSGFCSTIYYYLSKPPTNEDEISKIIKQYSIINNKVDVPV